MAAATGVVQPPQERGPPVGPRVGSLVQRECAVRCGGVRGDGRRVFPERPRQMPSSTSLVETDALWTRTDRCPTVRPAGQARPGGVGTPGRAVTPGRRPAPTPVGRAGDGWPPRRRQIPGAGVSASIRRRPVAAPHRRQSRRLRCPGQAATRASVNTGRSHVWTAASREAAARGLSVHVASRRQPGRLGLSRHPRRRR